MARKQFSFENLDVWQDARRLVTSVYAQTRLFPKFELYGMTSQLNRAAISIANNLAEGSARASLKDQAHFSNQACGSLMEVASDLIISTDLGFLPAQTSDPVLDQAYDLAVRISNFRASQLRRAGSS